MKTAALAFAAVSMLAATASAQEPAESADMARARELFTEGVERAQQERWGEAEDAFRQAHELYSAPSISLAWAGALQRLSRHADAQRAFAQWLTLSDSEAGSAERLEVERQMSEGRQRFAVVQVQVSPAGADVRLDGAPAPLTEGELWLDPGVYRLAVSLEGHVPVETEISASAGGEERVEITLEPEPEEPAPTEPAPAEVLPEPEPEPVAASSDVGGWAVLGVGAGVTVIGAIVLALGVTDYNSVTGATDGTAWDDLEPAYQRAPGEIVGGAVVVGVGLAAMALGLTLALTSGGDEDVALRVGPGSLTVAGRFR